MLIGRTFAAIAIAAFATTALHATNTGITGSAQPFTNFQPSLVVNQTVTLTGYYPSRYLTDGTGGSNAIGVDDTLASIHMFAGAYAPRGTALAQGQTLPIQQNMALYSLLGVNYGGNGSSNFKLPDLQGRSVTGAGQGAGLSGHYVGDAYGHATTTLTVDNLPSHSHTVPNNPQPTSATGGNQAFDSTKPALAMTYLINTQGSYPTAGGGDGFLGQIEAFAGNFEPVGWAAADGRAMSVRDNAALFSIVGTTFGGDGVNTFNLPDLRGRAAVGASQSIRLGDAFGRETTSLTVAQLPAHNHSTPDGATGTVGQNAPIDNMGPSLGLNYIIATVGVFPTQNLTAGSNLSMPGDAATLGEISIFSGNIAPTGWMFAQGQTLSIVQNQALYALLGTTYGGNGQTTFQLPDFRGRTALGAGSAFGQSFTPGQVLGTATTVLTTANLPPHDHVLPAAVPEPASWATMITGFGLIGGTLRRRARAAVAA